MVASSWTEVPMLVQNSDDKGELRIGAKSASVAGMVVDRDSLVLAIDGYRVERGAYLV